MEELFDVGNIVNTHGIKGEVRVMNITDFPEERYQPGATLFLTRENHETLELTVKSHRLHKKFHLLSFEGYDSINDVEIFVGGTIQIPEVDLADLEDDSFYVHDVIGIKVKDENGQEIGHVKEILESPANDVWIVQRNGKKDLLLPVITSVILEVDVDNHEATVHILEGLDTDAN